MDIQEFDSYIRTLLTLEEWAGSDPSLNGLQVGRRSREIKRAAFAVDACTEVFKRAAEWKADLVFVHHGLFWGPAKPVTGPLYKRLEILLNEDIALYAVHLPLDMDPLLGNNAALAELLSLQEIKPFGRYKGKMVGFKGVLPEPLTLSRIADLLKVEETDGLVTLPFGPAKIKTAGIISGGASQDVEQAVEEGLDLFITGEASHSVFHYTEEAGISVLCGGHYKTEIWGVNRVCRKVAEDCSLETCFIDLPTGL